MIEGKYVVVCSLCVLCCVCVLLCCVVCVRVVVLCCVVVLWCVVVLCWCVVLYVLRIALAKKNFTLKYDTNIPRQVVSARCKWWVQG